MKKPRQSIIKTVLGILISNPPLLASLLFNIAKIYFIRLRSWLSMRPWYILSLSEHIGDIVAAEPIVRFVRSQHKNARLYWVIDKKYRALVIKNPSIDAGITITCFSEWILLRKFIPATHLFDLHIHNKTCEKHGLTLLKKNTTIHTGNYLQQGNLLYCFSRSAGLPVNPDSAPRLHLATETSNPVFKKPYIVVHSSSNNPEKEWNQQGWQELAEYLQVNYSGFTLVEIGFRQFIHSSSTSYINFCGSRNLRDIAALIAGSVLFIGVDSAFAHFANALTKDSVVLMGSYQGEEKYMPFSGMFKREKDRHIFSHRDKLSSLKFNELESFIKGKLQTINEKLPLPEKTIRQT